MRIAVWNTAFLGDSVLTLPLIRVLKAAYPEAEIDFYVRGGLASLYEAQPEIARVFSCDKRGKEKGLAAMLRQGREIRQRGYDIWVDAHLSLRSSYMAWASGAKVRVGYREAVLSALVFTKRTSRRFKELAEKPDCPTYEEILKDIIQRDYNDMNRETAPLKQAEDAVLVDTTELTLEQSAARIAEIIKERV